MLVPDSPALRSAFINSSRSKAASAALPAPWPPEHAEELDFIGWVDPKAPRRAYLIVGPGTTETLTAIELRLPSSVVRRPGKSMCDLCQSAEAPGGSVLMVAPRAGARGKGGDSVGLYICSDFGCSLRARRPLKTHERSVSGQPDTRVEDLVARVLSFVERVASSTDPT
jgi:hypothetical protein